MKRKALLILISLLIAACLAPVGGSAMAQSPQASAADNSAQNQKDRDHHTVTPIDQSNKPQDLKISREIRRAVVNDKGLSTEAKNIKIITIDGAVTLRGPVKSERERAEIQAKAARVAGDTNVNDQLEIAGSK